MQSKPYLYLFLDSAMDVGLPAAIDARAPAALPDSGAQGKGPGAYGPNSWSGGVLGCDATKPPEVPTLAVLVSLDGLPSDWKVAARQA